MVDPVAGNSTAVLELRAVHLADIAAELSTPRLTTGGFRAWPIERNLTATATTAPDMMSAERLVRLQSLVAQSIADRRQVTAEPEVTRYIIAVVRHHSHWWAELTHPTADAIAFRRALTDEVATNLGTQLVAQLIRRPLLGIVSDAHPYYGWATHQELQPVIAELGSGSGPLRRMNHETDTDALRTFRTCMAAAADRQLDLVTIYDVS